MAYLSAEDTKKIRTALKTNFKQFKFSVTRAHYTGVNITILSGPKDFGASNFNGHLQLNEYNDILASFHFYEFSCLNIQTSYLKINPDSSTVYL